MSLEVQSDKSPQERETGDGRPANFQDAIHRLRPQNQSLNEMYAPPGLEKYI